MQENHQLRAQLQALEVEAGKKLEKISCLEDHANKLQDFTEVVQSLNDQLLGQVSGISQRILSAPPTGYPTLTSI